MRFPFTRYGGTTFWIAAVLPTLAGAVLAADGRLLPAFPFLALGLFSLWFFRDPERRIPSDAGALVSAADGRVVVVDEVDEPTFVGGRALRVGVFLSVFDVHVNRAPEAGVVRHLRYTPGRFLDARDPRSRSENEANAIGIELDDGSRLLVRQVAGLIARRIVCAVKEGERVARGQRIGMIKFGSYTEVLAPAAAFEPLVRPGDRVKGGASLVARRRA